MESDIFDVSREALNDCCVVKTFVTQVEDLTLHAVRHRVGRRELYPVVAP